MTIRTDTDRFAPITRGQLFAEVLLTLIDMSDPDSADSEAWAQCLEEAWPRHQTELSRASAWAIVGRLTRSGVVTQRAHELRSSRRTTEEK